MAKCAVCGKEVLMPFKCSYCGEYFCAEHRLPEKHNCPGLFAAASPYEKEKKKLMASEEKASWEPVSWTPSRRRRPLAGRESLHLLMGTLLVILIGFSLIGYHFWLSPWILALFITGFSASFLLHELGHRAYAKSHGLSARFRLDPFGALLTLVTAVPMMPFKIIAPGAVVITGITSLEVLGMTALVGPLINLVLSSILNIAAFVLSQLSGTAALQFLLFRLGAFNAFIAFFNLIPFGELDGKKVFAWNPVKWGIAFATSIALLIISFAI